MEVVNSSEEFQDLYKSSLKYKDNECGEYTRWSKTGVYRRNEINWDIKDKFQGEHFLLLFYCYSWLIIFSGQQDITWWCKAAAKYSKCHSK